MLLRENELDKKQIESVFCSSTVPQSTITYGLYTRAAEKSIFLAVPRRYTQQLNCSSTVP